MKILLTGKNGQLGKELHRGLPKEHDVIALGREDIDLGHENQVRYLFKHLPPFSLLINCAAYTAVDEAETNPDQAQRINADAVELLAQEALRREIPMIHFSTDYVFDGRQNTPYSKTDRPNPLSVYGKTKLEGEERVRLLLDRHLIFRLSGLYGEQGKNFFLGMLGHFHQRRGPRVVCDQVTSPNCSSTIADAVSRVIRQMEAPLRDFPWGTYHLTGPGETTWYEFAETIFEDARKIYDTPPAGPIAVTTQQFGAAAPRPAYSVLDGNKFQDTFGIEVPDWEVQYRCFINELFRDL